VIERFLDDRRRNTPARVAIDYDGRLVTYCELADGADAFAAAFAEAGLKRGDRLATLTGNRPEHVMVLFACARLGLILLPLSWRLTAPELRYQLEDAEPSLFLVEEEYEELAEATGKRHETLSAPAGAPSNGDNPMGMTAGDDRVGKTRAAAGGRRDETFGTSSRGDTPLSSVRDDDPLLLIYTSGTTGKPKGALLTHANCFWTNVSFDATTGVHNDDVVLQVLPQFHVGGWNVQSLLAWLKGATVVLERQFDAGRVLRLIEEKRVTTMMGVPPIYLFLAQHPRFAEADLSSLERAVVGGAPMPEPLLETWAARGTAIVQGYGLTEAAPNVLCLPPEDAVRKLGCAGKPYPFVDVRLGEGSELQVRGPNVFAGYWRNPEATAHAFTDDGWLRTGDVAEADEEGFYRIKGRLKDMYISGGENVYPAEVEHVLHEHPAVADAAVVGVPHERWGEVGIAFVVCGGATEEELVAWCAARLARFKVPSAVRFVDEIPRNSLGKIQKQGLLAAGRDGGEAAVARPEARIASGDPGAEVAG
jgi:fatty-acyl-CoA synthase